MSLSLQDLNFLTSARGTALLDRLAGESLDEAGALALITRLRATHSADEARAALALARVRRKAVERFGEAAARLFLTEDALQQASDPLARAHRAQVLFEAGVQRVIDAGCGIGADTFACASQGMDALGLDRDLPRLVMARLNAAALDLPNARFAAVDLRQGLPLRLPPGDPSVAVFFDPARRDETGRRLHDVRQYRPPLALIDTWRATRVAVKLSPGVDLAQLEPYLAGGRGGVAFVSVEGALKEAVLWRGFGWAGTRATRLDAAGTHHLWREGAEPEVGIRAPGAWLLEPDPAAIRATLVRDLAARCGAHLLDASIAYLTADTLPVGEDRVWLRAWRVLDWMPFQLKRLKAHLRAGHVGHLTVKKRGFPMTPEALIARLKPRGSESRTLVVTRHAGAPVVLICEDGPVRVTLR